VKYPVTSIFRSIQGEGHFVGYPMTFVRLAGCSVRDCSIRAECDEAPWKATEMLTAAEIQSRCREMAACGIVCITGGEPTDHDLIPLVDSLTRIKLRIHLETSGIRELVGLPIEWITVSPKTGYYHQRTGHTLKIVVRESTDWPDVEAIDTGTSFFHRYLQPLADSPGALRKAIQLVSQSLDARWALSTQAHKTWGLR
jgi:7-carboxy-7-deazaguanine synthase